MYVHCWLGNSVVVVIVVHTVTDAANVVFRRTQISATYCYGTSETTDYQGQCFIIPTQKSQVWVEFCMDAITGILLQFHRGCGKNSSHSTAGMGLQHTQEYRINGNSLWALPHMWCLSVWMITWQLDDNLMVNETSVSSWLWCVISPAVPWQTLLVY